MPSRLVQACLTIGIVVSGKELIPRVPNVFRVSYVFVRLAISARG